MDLPCQRLGGERCAVKYQFSLRSTATRLNSTGWLAAGCANVQLAASDSEKDTTAPNNRTVVIVALVFTLRIHPGARTPIF